MEGSNMSWCDHSGDAANCREERHILYCTDSLNMKMFIILRPKSTWVYLGISFFPTLLSFLNPQIHII